MGRRQYITPGALLPLPGGGTQYVSQALFTGPGYAGVLRSHPAFHGDAPHVVWDVDADGNATVRTLRDDAKDAGDDFRGRVAELLVPGDSSGR